MLSVTSSCSYFKQEGPNNNKKNNLRFHILKNQSAVVRATNPQTWFG